MKSFMPLGHLADSRSVGIVGDGHGDADYVLDHLGEEDDHRLVVLVVRPLEVGSELDGALVVVAVGGSDTDTLHLTVVLGLLDKVLDGRGQIIHISGQSGIDYTELGGLTAHVDTHYQCLFCHNT